MRSTMLAFGFLATTLFSACGGDTNNPAAVTPENNLLPDSTKNDAVDSNNTGQNSDETDIAPLAILPNLAPPFSNCPTDIAAAIDTPGLLDPAVDGTSPSVNTFCLQRTNNLRVVVALNSAALNGAKTQAQQITNLNNIVTDYEKYGLTIGTNVDIVVIGYGAGARWLLTDTAFDAFFGSDPAVAETNIALPIVTTLLNKGVKFFACQNTMINTKLPGTTTNIKTTDLTPAVNMVPAGVTALLDFQYLRYMYITP